MKKKILAIITVALLTMAVAFASITASEAKAIAFKDANVNEKDVSRLSVKNDYEDGLRIYDIEFIANGSEYDYEIDYENGTIISFDHEREYGFVVTEGAIDKNRALSIALSDANVSEKEASSKRSKREVDDGIVKYEVEFKTKSFEYDYDISESGEILKSSFEVRGRIPSNRNKTLLTLEEVERIASEVLSEVNTNDIRIVRDYDDGLYIYELTAFNSDYDYEAEIDAATGDLLSYSKELIYY